MRCLGAMTIVGFVVVAVYRDALAGADVMELFCWCHFVIVSY